MKIALKILAFLLLFPAFANSSDAASASPRACSGSQPNWTAATWADVQACHTAASTGYTITVSSGSYAATTNTAITKFGKIICAGSCIVTDNVTNLDDVITITESTSGHTRLEGFTFVRGTGQHQNPNGVIRLVNATGGLPILVTANSYAATTSGDFIVVQTNRGVIWNNSITATWDNVPGTRCSNNVAFVRHKFVAGTSVWTEAPYYGMADSGGDKNLYIENNTLDNAFEGIDSDSNARTVVRNNTIINSGVVGHGADTSSVSHRYLEIYGNTFVWDTTPRCGSNPASVESFIYLRGAPAVIRGNTIPNITSMAWGDKSEVNFANEQLRRNAGTFGCWTGGYPSPYQVGYGYTAPLVQAGTSGIFQGIEGVYLSNNTGAGNYSAPSVVDYAPNECGPSAPLVSTFIQSGREYFLAMAKPAYTSYIYPHPLTVAGNVYYVTKSGSDGNSCSASQSIASARFTVVQGIDCLSGGDTLLIGDGSYPERLRDIVPSGSSGAPTTIQAINRLGVILNPTISDWFYAVEVVSRSYITFDGLDVSGAGISGYPVIIYGSADGDTHHIKFMYGKVRDGGQNPTHCDNFPFWTGLLLGQHNAYVADIEVGFTEIVNNGEHGLYAGASKNSWYHDNNIHGNGGFGIHEYDGGRNENEDNLFERNISWANGFDPLGPGCGQPERGGAGVLSDGTNSVFKNNLIYGNNYYGMQFWGANGTTSTKFYFNTIYNNGTSPGHPYCIDVQSNAGLGNVARNNICWANGNNTILQSSPITQDHNLCSSGCAVSANPQFVNAGAANFALTNPGSPAIAAGVAVVGVTTDYNGTPRPNPPSIGAYDVASSPGSITVVSPNSGVRTAVNLSVTLTGSGTPWVNGTTIGSFSGTGITVNSTTVSSTTSAVLSVTIAANATLGLRNVSMNTSGSIASITNGFTVLAAPSITSVSPNSGTRGTASLNVALTGSNTAWVQGTSVGSFSGTGVTVNSTTVTSATAATLNITISPTATLGLLTVTVNTGGSLASITNGFTVNNSPSISIVSPSSGVQFDAALVLTLTGVATNWSNGVSVCSLSGTGITVNSTTVASTTSATCNITISGTATVGLRDLTMTTGASVVTRTNAFTVNAAPTPSISNISPPNGDQGATIALAVTGLNTHFSNGVSVCSLSGSGITVNSTTVALATSLACNITIAGGATLGARDLTITTGAEVVTSMNGFTVTVVPPVIDPPDNIFTSPITTSPVMRSPVIK